ncbi:MAG TPA: bifunctional [glutamine synthetase] adenylyltransferase/[glutamine synthetase]-adenylyl-L-tyrosine phosphorylase [Stellaceae bacterium]|nr:bifunctional [glutamine synthetase] adenylyltransferase/[glutamine synthetase]-adenylyl-L-tyrosine phosphorylase [Stellaceae bacterium]
MSLLSHLSPDGGGLPLAADARLLALGQAAWQEALAEAPRADAAAAARGWSETPAGQRLLAAIFGNSPFLAGVATREWEFLTELVRHGPDRLLNDIIATLSKAPNDGENRAALMCRLRVARRRVALLAAVAEFARVWDLENQMQALTGFAEAAIDAALRHLLQTIDGTPFAPEAKSQESGLIVLGMGKLGGGELNYSSDIDLILLYDPARSPPVERDLLHGFFNRLARELVRILDERTGDGYVFRTDLRLRPDPRSTPLVMSVAAALGYYESVGQNWERAALIKARPVAGDRVAGAGFLAELQPYIWRRHLDFAAIADIHSIKRQIQAHRGGGRIAVYGHDIKIGRGGIREIEFFAQTQQLIWGGRRRELRVGATCEALRRLATAGQIDAETATALIAAYRFLRRVEHRLQMVEDAQTHRLPADAEGIARLAVFLGYPDADAFTTELVGTLTTVERRYADLFEEAPSLAGPGNLVFTGSDDDPATLATLAQMGFAEPSEVAGMVRDWHHGRMRATRSQRAREILTELVPELLRIFGATAQPGIALRRFDEFLSRLPAGVQLFSLFHANPGLLRLVADIMAEAPLLAESLSRRPALLEAVLSADFFAPLADKAGLASDLADSIEGTRHFEEVLDLARRWANERRFQVGVQLLHRNLDGAAAGAVLADIAETVLAALVPAVAADFARPHGTVPGGEFALVAMGRLGSREMTLASDLDLILIYDAPAESEQSDGPRPLAISTYYARLTQRLIAAITAPTAEGRLYEVDMRLRPSGASGPIASKLDAFARYQRESAWTWEHMALTRARPLAGDQGLRTLIEAAIAAALTVPRDPARLAADVAEMRERIAAEHPHPAAWDLRNRRGGLVDLEFIAQFLMLREAARAPGVLRRDTGAALAALHEAGALPPQGLQALGDALALLRHVRALLTVLFDGIPAPEALAGPAGATLARCAGAVDFARLDADIIAACADVVLWYDRLIAAPARQMQSQAAEYQAAQSGKPETGGVTR